jgi:malate dehydrogenase
MTAQAMQGYAGDEQLGEALKGCDLVVIPAGMPRKPGMSRDDLFKVNASIVQVRLLPYTSCNVAHQVICSVV